MTGPLVMAWQLSLEATRTRVMWVIPFYAVFSALFLPTVADLTMGSPTRGMTDIGLFILWITGSGVALWLGVQAIGRPLQGSAVMMLYRPLGRQGWVFGRLAGASLVLAGMVLGLVGTWVLLALWWGIEVTTTLGWYAVLLWLELVIVAGIAGLLSAMVEPVAATVFAGGVWAAGHMTGELAATSGWALQDLASRVVLVLVPDLQRFTVHEQVVHQLPVHPVDAGWTLLYGFVWALILAALTAMVVSRRDLE